MEAMTSQEIKRVRRAQDWISRERGKTRHDAVAMLPDHHTPLPIPSTSPTANFATPKPKEQLYWNGKPVIEVPGFKGVAFINDSVMQILKGVPDEK